MSKLTRPPAPAPRKRRPQGNELERIFLSLGYSEELPPETTTARVAAAALFAIETAMRTGEICGLSADNIDYERRVAHLAQTKNGHSRDVPLSREAIRVLKRLPPVDSGPVFAIAAASLDVLWRKGSR